MEGIEEKKDQTALGEDDEEFVEQIDPVLLKPDLYAAAAANDWEKVRGFLLQSVPPTFVDTASGLTPLHWAAMFGNVKMVTGLLEKGASEPYHRLLDKALRAKQEQDLQGDSVKQTLSRADDEDGNAEDGKYERENDGTLYDEEEEEGEEDLEKSLEVSTDLLKNTPLLWATYKGHLDVIWLLLKDGYSPNDVDKMENNALHLAAAYGDLKILRVLIDDGGNANVVNHYRNLPIDMSKTKEVRDMLAVAMELGASMTEKDIAEKHEKNMRQFKQIVHNLNDAVRSASRINDPQEVKDIAMEESLILASKLAEAINVGKEWSLDGEVIAQGQLLLTKLELSQELINDIIAVQEVMPIRTQSSYIQHVSKLEKSIERAHEAGVDEQQLSAGMDLITRCQIEYWLSVMLERLKDVVSADDSNEHDMIKLTHAVQKARDQFADEALIQQGATFLNRLNAELGMSRAIKHMPTYKLPPPDGVITDGYWTENDIGAIKETEGFPLPPADTGEYIWIPAAAFEALGAAIEALKSSYDGAEELGANPDIIAKSKEMLIKAEKDFKILENKDAADKAHALEVVKKQAKKLKGGKKKGAKK